MPPRARVGLALAVALGGLGASSAAAWTGTRLAEDALLLLCATVLAVELLLASGALALALLTRAGPRRALGLAPGRLPGRDLMVLLLGALGASHALDGALELSGVPREGALFEVPRLLEGAAGWRLAAALVAIGLVPGVAEELLCRGLLQRALTRRAGPGPGIGTSALVFGLLHLEPLHIGLATILGLYLGLVAHWAGSTRPAIACHAANNLAAIALAAAGGVPASPLSVALAALLGAGSLAIVARRRRRRARAAQAGGPRAGFPPGPAAAPAAQPPAADPPPRRGLQREAGSDDR